ncbi:MAG: GNAT family N-acetyltransferase [Hyphomicrobiales bacterium]|nr:GNAT family N-acetyltransferase [Hyphomicrobiales bacterium]
MSYTIAVEDVNGSGISELIDASDAYSAERYPPEGNFATDLAGLYAPEIALAVARKKGFAAGCAALKSEPHGNGELKRLFVHPDARGSGLGGRLIDYIEALARARGVRRINLETGPLNVEAVGLYRAYGYVECGPFGDYEDNPYSLFMTKDLGPAD